MEKAGKKITRLFWKCGLGAALAAVLNLLLYLAIGFSWANSDILIIFFGSFILLYEYGRDIELLEGWGTF